MNTVETTNQPNAMLLKGEGFSAFLRNGDGEEKITRIAESVQKILEEEKTPLWMCELILERVRKSYGNSLYKG